jgi:hypothetical protein
MTNERPESCTRHGRSEPRRVCRKIQLMSRIWLATISIPAKIGCTPQAPNDWVKRADVNNGPRVGIPTGMAEKMKA